MSVNQFRMRPITGSCAPDVPQLPAVPLDGIPPAKVEPYSLHLFDDLR